MQQGLSSFIGTKLQLVETTRLDNKYSNGGVEHASLIALAAKHTAVKGGAEFARRLHVQIRVVSPDFEVESFLPPNAKDFSSMYDKTAGKKRKAAAGEVNTPNDSEEEGGPSAFELPDPSLLSFAAAPAAAGGAAPEDDAARAAIGALKALGDAAFVPTTGAVSDPA